MIAFTTLLARRTILLKWRCAVLLPLITIDGYKIFFLVIIYVILKEKKKKKD